VGREGDEKCILVGKPEWTRSLVRPDVCGGIILKFTLCKYSEGADWIQLAHDVVQWRALLNTMMNLRVPYKREIS
jgi:hypothetical protein